MLSGADEEAGTVRAPCRGGLRPPRLLILRPLPLRLSLESRGCCTGAASWKKPTGSSAKFQQGIGCPEASCWPGLWRMQRFSWAA